MVLRCRCARLERNDIRRLRLDHGKAPVFRPFVFDGRLS
jgi:hypothetical protein